MKNIAKCKKRKKSKMATTSNNNNNSGSNNGQSNANSSTSTTTTTTANSMMASNTSINTNNPLFQNSPSSSLFLMVNPLPSTDDELNDKILETIEKLRTQSNNSSTNGSTISTTNNGNNGGQNVPVINFPGSTESSSDGKQQQQQPSASLNSTTQTVLQCVVGRNHVAVLMDDNRVCRYPFTVVADRINSNSQNESTASSNKKTVYPQPITSSSSVAASAAAVAAAISAPGSSSPRSIPSRRRLVRRGGRSAASVIMSRSQIMQNTHVPEELINQAQNVLQGKSRNVIMRELQRTNLDVNSAVNNLLSRDDEDFDDADDAADHLIGSDDLISLLDSGFHNDHSVIIDPDFTSEEVFPYQVRIRGSNYFPSTNTSASGQTNGTSASNNNLAAGITGRVVRPRDEAYSLERDLNAVASQKRWYHSVSDAVKTLDVTLSGRSKKKCDQLQLPPISFTDQQEYWLGPNDRKFVQIASLHSELIAVNNNGRLCQWRWQDPEPFKGATQDGINYYHPRVPSLALLEEKINLLSASVIRATVVTETNKIATWIDESISMIAWKLEHTAANSIFTETLSSSCTGPLKIVSLYVSSLMSCVQLSTGALFWWGTPPFAHRKKMAEKGQNEKNKSKSKSTSGSTSSTGFSKENEIVQGTLVCMRNSPIYQCGAIGFTTVSGVPKIGQLVSAAWKITESYSFRVLTVQEIQSKLSTGSANSGGNGAGNNVSASNAIPMSAVVAAACSSSASQSNGGGGSSNSSLSKNLERSEMPPPPSPASSTSSESSNTNAPTVKRARNRNLSANQQQQASNLSSSLEDKNSDRIETWNLSDVVFMEDVKNMPIGRVIKVDGNYVAVKFSASSTAEASAAHSNAGNKNNDQHTSLSPTATSAAGTTTLNASVRTTGDGGNSNLIESYIQDCRLLRKEDLVAIRTYPQALASASSLNNTMVIGHKAYDHFQRTPKRVPIAEHMQILAMTLTNLGLHVIAKIGGYRLSYLQINIVSGRIEHDNKLSIEYSTFFGSGANPKSSLIRLFSAGENEQTTVVLCRDGNGTLYPLAKDCTNTVIREPISLNMGPISSIGLGVFSLANINGGGMNMATGSSSSSSSSSQQAKTHAAIMAFVMDRQYLMPAILSSNLDLVRECLVMLNAYPNVFYSMIGEICDGNHNILHIAVSTCFPGSNKPPATNSNDSVQIHLQVVDDDDVLDRSANMATDSNENSSDTAHQPAYTENTEPLLDPMEQNPIAHSILWTLMDSPALSRHLFDLLTARDYQGLTPFMLAISGRAYSAAQQIFVVIQRVARMIACNNENNSSDSSDIYQRAFLQMLYPRGSSPDHSPLYMLCSNDTCSFTWTGEEHINQDIFECRTCGLVGSLCCCTECARVCHRGHDCKLKRTSPTAYCDCWEKCKCKALVAGCQSARYSLLKRLLATTDLSTRVNSRGEHILLFLVQTVGRQITEQKQYRPTRLRPFSTVGGSRGSKNEPTIDETSLPEHDLEPPKFARRVLEKLLGDWITVKSMILTGYRSSENQTAQQRRRPYLWNLNGTANTYSYEEENSYLSCQNGSALLDKFTHSLLKLNLNDAVERITGTIVLACKNQNTAQEGRIVARRFVRSVIRVSSMILFETNPVQYSISYLPFKHDTWDSSYIDSYLSNTTMPGSSLSSVAKKSNVATMIKKIRRVFLVLLPIACEELCEIAESLIAPVRLGLCLPSNSFVVTPSAGSSSNSNDSSGGGGSLTDELFSVDTSVYSHQRDFLDPTLSLHEMMDEPPAQESLPPSSSHLLWNTYESSSTADATASGSRNNDESGGQHRHHHHHQQQQQQQSSTQQSRPREEDRTGILPNNNQDNSNVSNDVEMNLSVDVTANNAPSHSMVYDLSQSNDSSTTQSASTNQVAGGPSSSGQVNNNNNNSNNVPSEIIIMRRVVENETNENSAAENVDHPMSSAADHGDMVMEMLVTNSEPDDYSNVGGRDTESDSESNPDDASYLSNADNASAQRSVVTGATAGSDVGVASLPYDDESLNSNPDDVDDDDDDEPDVEPDDDDSSDSSDFSDTPETEPENDVLSNFISHTVDRRINSGGSNSAATRHNLMQHVQWALRGREAILSSTGSNVQESSLRRGGGGGGGVSSALVSMDNVVQIPNTMVGLSRSFSIIVRHIADLMVIVRDAQVEMPSIDFAHLTITPAEARQLVQTMEDRLRLTWNWLINCMDSTETQLRFGCALSNRRLAPTSSSTLSNGGSSASNQASAGSNSTDSATNLINSLAHTNPRFARLRTFQSQDEMAMLPTFNRSNLRRNNSGPYLFARTSATAGSVGAASVNGSNSTSGGGSGGGGGGGGNSGNSGGGSNSNNITSNEANLASHRDFLNYAMSLMRAHSNEHYDSLPMLDVGSHKHVAYIFDAFVYFMRKGIFAASKLDFSTQTVEEESITAGENSNRSFGNNTNSKSNNNSGNKEESSGRNQVFFRRSNSTLYLGCPRPDPFSAPYHEALPLADKPHLLQPNARREQLFGIPRPSNDLEAEEMLEQLPSQMSLARRQQWNYVRMPPTSPTSGNHSLSANQSSPTPARSQSVITESPMSSRGSIIHHQQPNKLSVIVMAGSAKHQQQQQVPGSSNHIATDHNYGSKPLGTTRVSTFNVGNHKVNYFGNAHQQDLLLGRWRLTLELFGRLFVEDVSLEPNSIIQELSGFPIKESKFRREMERLRISCSSSSATQRDLNFYKLDRDRNALLIQTFKELNSVFSSVTRRLTSQTMKVTQPLTITRVKVTFKDEPGEGTGVARSFYTAFSEAVLTNEKLPPELLINYGNNRHSGCTGHDVRDAYSSFMFRLRNQNGSNANANNIQLNTRARMSSSSGAGGGGGGGAPLANNDGSSITLSSSLRRPRSPARHRSFFANAAVRRTQLIERIRNMHEPRSSTSSSSATAAAANSSNNDQQSNSADTSSTSSSSSSSLHRRLSSLRYEAPSFVPMLRTIIPNESRSAVVPPIGLRIFNRVYEIYPSHASKITGMLIDLNQELLNLIVNNNDDLRMFIDHAMELIQQNEGIGVRNPGGGGSGGAGGGGGSSSSASAMPLNNSLYVASPFDQSGNGGGGGGGGGNDSTTAASTSSSQQYPAQQQQQQQQNSSQVASQVLPFLAASAFEYETLYVGNSKACHKSAGESSSSSLAGVAAPLEFQDEDDNAPMFYQPGTRGFYCPRAGRASENRLNAFRNVGRIIGVCFVQNELCPITFNRHVIKMILGQPVAWHDLAFFDSELYESLRQLILDAESNNKEEIFSECDFRFAIDLPPEEGGHEVELMANGRNIRVTPQNVYEYVRRYAKFRMVDSQEKAILAIRAGIFDVIPDTSFDGLTAEDFRLLLNGVNEINVQQLQTYVTFYDESGDPDPMNNFQKWFWWVVDRMTNEEKQDLIYFWTGSPALPASEEGFQPKPSVTVRPRDDLYFVTANTCISRLYIPLYSSRNILRQKLLMSIKSKSFGFI